MRIWTFFNCYHLTRPYLSRFVRVPTPLMLVARHTYGCQCSASWAKALDLGSLGFKNLVLEYFDDKENHAKSSCEAGARIFNLYTASLPIIDKPFNTATQFGYDNKAIRYIGITYIPELSTSHHIVWTALSAQLTEPAPSIWKDHVTKCLCLLANGA